MFLIERHADRVFFLECGGVIVVDALEMCNQVGNRLYIGRKVQGFFFLADTFPHPGKIANVHETSCCTAFASNEITGLLRDEMTDAGTEIVVSRI